MKSKNINFIILLSLIIFSCSSNDITPSNNNLNDFVSTLCENATGPTGGLWDNAHGLPIPLTNIPTIANPGQHFIHSQYPALGFTMPQGYSGFESQNGLGVDVIRNDNQVVWRYMPSLNVPNQTPILDILANEINLLFAFYNHSGDFEVICEQNTSQPNGASIISSSSRLIRFGNITATVLVNSYFETSLGSTFASLTTISGPTAEYDTLVMNDFLPINWQLLVIDNGIRDSDLDGTPDNQDNFPFDPNRQ
ncbi:hypothetical protein DFQ11_11114 [Winogradskyella epiphytica]|uniref:Uncharacterized protein n=1 Tax=Winogradskyella epiphytica TaxID=262005 RepID=A0A2V4XFL4_9FLAO|nr:hypothetical protein [Winogradskyella epiphytica]PYE79574.1 hypothetical protein DFQ11_11114 [Winogradskyella epiphytica]GGW74315.1 hypothetical protein GCM10008085_28080 [Winogradskyella epiphytica]